MKRWQSSWPMGRMVGHPAVVEELVRAPSSIRPQLRRRDGVAIVSYRRTRVYLDRDAWEMLPDDGVLLMRVCPTYRAAFALAFTKDELENVFGEVRATRSWDEARCYHFPQDPPAIRSFRVAHPPTSDGQPGSVVTAGTAPPLRTSVAPLAHS